MNILLITNRYYPSIGGAETTIKRFAEGLVKSGHSVTVWTSLLLNSDGYKKHEKTSETIAGVKILRMKSIRILKDPLTFLYPLFYKLPKEAKNYDLVHVYTYGYSTSWIPLLLKSFGLVEKPIIFTPHYAPIESVPTVFTKIYDLLLGRMTIKKANAIFLLTDKYLDLFSSNSNVHIIPPISDKISKSSETEIDEIFTRFNIPRGKKYILSLSRVVKYKGIEQLVRSFNLAAHQINDIHLVIAGNGDYLTEAKDLALKLEISEKVTFTGEVTDSDRSGIYSLADVFTLLSYSGESFGLTLVEAMQLGTPIIASNRGAIPRVVKNGINGFIVDPFNYREVAQKIKEILRPENSKKFSQNNLKEVTKYDENSVIEKSIEAYKELLDNKK